MLIYEKRFRRYATHRGQIAIKTKRPNGLQYLTNSLIFRHNTQFWQNQSGP